MSFRNIAREPCSVERQLLPDEGAFEVTARNGLIEIQNNVRSVGGLVSRLSHGHPTPEALSTFKASIAQCSASISALEDQFLQWKRCRCDDSTALTRRKLFLPQLEANLNAEIEKLRTLQESGKSIENRLQYNPSEGDDLLSPKTPSRFTPSDLSDFTNIPLGFPSAPTGVPHNSASPYLQAKAPETAGPSPFGLHFYEDEDDYPQTDKRHALSSLSTGSGRSTSSVERRNSSLTIASSTPSSRRLLDQRDSQAGSEDDFLEDGYLSRNHAAFDVEDEDEETQELLLARGPALDDWHLTVGKIRQEEDNLELYVSRERLEGVHSIRAQLAQVSTVFKELANLLSDQKSDLDLLDNNIMNSKNATGLAVEELRKAHARKQRSRRRKFYVILFMLVVASIVAFVTLAQPSASPISLLRRETHPANISPPEEAADDSR